MAFETLTGALMSFNRFCACVVLSFCCFASCESARPVVATDVTPRKELRAEAVGCWRLRASASGGSPAESLFVRIDSIAPPGQLGVGIRNVQRLDERGNKAARDAEGFAVQDWWTADARSDTIRFLFNNGLYGANWAFELPTGDTARVSLLGSRQGFGDVVPSDPYPVQNARATRVQCVASVNPATDK